MLRYEAIETIYPDLRDHIVVTIMGAVAAELYTAGHRPNFFYLEHAMGLASSMGLGIALAIPRHKVIVLDGDGSLLMNLGTCSTSSLTTKVCFPWAASQQQPRPEPISRVSLERQVCLWCEKPIRSRACGKAYRQRLPATRSPLLSPKSRPLALNRSTWISHCSKIASSSNERWKRYKNRQKPDLRKEVPHGQHNCACATH